MTRYQNKLAQIRAHINQVWAIRNQMLAQMDYCPAEVRGIVLGNIDKADRELRRLNRERRGIERELATR